MDFHYAGIFRFLVLTTLSTSVRNSTMITKQFISRAMIGFIRLYQLVAPSWIRNCCRYTPTCSQYAIMVIDEYGPIKGLSLSLLRLLRCIPPFGGSDWPDLNEKGKSDDSHKLSRV